MGPRPRPRLSRNVQGRARLEPDDDDAATTGPRAVHLGRVTAGEGLEGNTSLDTVGAVHWPPLPCVDWRRFNPQSTDKSKLWASSCHWGRGFRLRWIPSAKAQIHARSSCGSTVDCGRFPTCHPATTRSDIGRSMSGRYGVLCGIIKWVILERPAPRDCTSRHRSKDGTRMRPVKSGAAWPFSASPTPYSLPSSSLAVSRSPPGTAAHSTAPSTNSWSAWAVLNQPEAMPTSARLLPAGGGAESHRQLGARRRGLARFGEGWRQRPPGLT